LASRAARRLLRRWQAAGVAVTMGADGALLATDEDVPLVAPARQVHVLDACGAGDRFAAAVAGALGGGALPTEAVTAAVEAATGYVEAGGPAALPTAGSRQAPAPGDAEEVVRRTRAAGGAVVATGGCFDPLHAGHIATLRAARRLGDCLVVCVNSDASVRRLRGPLRPAVPVGDRVRMLAALGCVDAVTVFDDDTPLAVLDRIRPDIWVKGGDYPASALPETELVARWGGDVVVVPYLAGADSAEGAKAWAR
jgi:rfaE bifunctional protein nucleotidyltransferase chain/domain